VVFKQYLKGKKGVKMAHAYTPGLRVTEKTRIVKERKLPLPGDVMVKIGDTVKAEDVVACTCLPGNVQTVNVAGLLGTLPEDVRDCMLKKEGETIKKNEVIAETKGFLGLFKSRVQSPTDGSIESISNVTGQVILREPPEPVEVFAYIDGKVVKIFEKEGVAIETYAAFIQGIFGIGGETYGDIKRVVEDEASILTSKEIDKNCKDKILIGGSLATSDGLKKSIEVGAKGIVVGGIADRDLRDFLGYDIGVAITGSETIGLTLVITEGFGKMRMARKTFNLLTMHEGKKASINGATQIRAGVIRPEVVVPIKEAKIEKEKIRTKTGLVVGSPIRIIREPFFGELGKVVALPSELQKIETEAKVRILEVELENGKHVTLPRANVEMIEK